MEATGLKRTDVRDIITAVEETADTTLNLDVKLAFYALAQRLEKSLLLKKEKPQSEQ